MKRGEKKRIKVNEKEKILKQFVLHYTYSMLTVQSHFPATDTHMPARKRDFSGTHGYTRLVPPAATHVATAKP